MIFFIFSFFICLMLPIIFRKFLSKNRLATNKEKPMFLGISIYLSLLVASVSASIYYKTDASFLSIILPGSFFMLLLGIIDDVKNLSVKAKLAGQIVVACIVILLGVRTSIVYLPAWANVIITLVWIVTLVNAFNFLDIMDGLCTGISFIICITYLAISTVSGAYPVSIFFWVLSGSILAALIHNAPLARFYLGDSGSMMIGFIFACSTMQISYAPDTKHGLSLFVPLLVLALPLYDLFFTVFMRLKKRMVIFKKSGEHFALMLKARGFNISGILTIMYTACLFSGIAALSLKIVYPSLKPWVLAAFAVLVFTWNIFMVKISNTNER
jgi:UDP-GlcNAc:undecaprenyl-phosphate/decaprenyl-phosphate GlcNAc-1-phosphate transferase